MKRSGPLRRSKPMHRRSPRAILEARLDKMLRQIVLKRDGNKCRMCGHGPEGRVLTAAHIMPKGQYPHMRYRIENVVAMCAYPCHLGARGWHNNPLASFDWAQKELGEPLLTRLGIMARIQHAKVDRTMDELSLRDALRKMGVEP